MSVPWWKRTYMVEREEEEWGIMWDALSAYPINRKCEDPYVCMNEECGEGWQYMGTQGLNHSFRHRCHPVTNRREHIAITPTTIPQEETV